MVQTFSGQIVFESEQIFTGLRLLVFSERGRWLSSGFDAGDVGLGFYFDIFLKWRVLTFYITFNGNVCEAICTP